MQETECEKQVNREPCRYEPRCGTASCVGEDMALCGRQRCAPCPVLAADGARVLGRRERVALKHLDWSRPVKSEQMATLALQKSSDSPCSSLASHPASAFQFSLQAFDSCSQGNCIHVVSPGLEKHSPHLLSITNKHSLPLSSEAIS